jgi:anti-sigma factor RsiW
MVVKCEEVWREISNYLDREIEPGLRLAMEEHIRGCQHCAAVLDGTQNVVQLYGDERMMEVPLGFSQRLQHRLDEKVFPTRRGFLGWMVAAAAALLIAGGIELRRAPSRLDVRSQQAQPGAGIPPDMVVVVSTDGKLFHRSGCPFIHDKAHIQTLTAREAIREGYAPCVRCMKQYLSAG